MFTSYLNPLILFLLVGNCSGISFNAPKFDVQSQWNSNGTVFADETILGKYPRNLFITNTNEILAFNQQTKQIILWSNSSFNYTSISIENLSNSKSFFVNNKKEIFIDIDGKNIDQITINGTFIQTIGFPSYSHSALFIGHQNDLYCSIESEHQIIQISLSAEIKQVRRIAGNGCAGPLLHMLDHPNGIYVNHNLTVFVADTNNHRILRFDENQTNGTAIAGFGSSIDYLLNKPTSITFDGNSLLYIVDSFNHRILRLISNEFQCLFGCSTQHQLLNHPHSMSFDPFGNIFITDSNHHRIIRFDLINNSTKKKQISIPNLHFNQTWKQYAITVVGNYKKANQLSSPYGMFINGDQSIIIADNGNHRIVEWNNNLNCSRIVAGGEGNGSQMNQLNFPTSVIMDQQNGSLIICDWENRRVVRWPYLHSLFSDCSSWIFGELWFFPNGQSGEVLISNIGCYDLKMDNDGYLYVSDRMEHEIRRWRIGERNGTLVAGGNGQGNRTDQLNVSRKIFIDEDHSVYVSDRDNHRVMKWVKGAKEGTIVAGGHGQGNGSNQLSSPYGIIVDQLGNVYVADSGNARVMRWLNGATKGTIIVGGNGEGQLSNQLYRPIDLSFDRANNLYVVDRENDRVQRFDVD